MNVLKLSPIFRDSGSYSRFNFDGYLTHDQSFPASSDTPANKVNQIFRNGIIESIVVKYSSQMKGEKYIYANN